MKSLFQFLYKLVSHHKTLLLVIVVVLITVSLQTLISTWLSRNNKIHLPSIGTIYTLNVEVHGPKVIDWGTVYPGITVSRVINISSKSNIEAVLIIKPMNWVFNDSQGEIVEGPTNETRYMVMTANLNGTLIHPNQTVEVTLTLKVTNSKALIDFLIKNDVETFSFNILIYLSEPH